MIGNFVRSNNKNIATKVTDAISQLPKNVPCKIDKINDDMTVDLISLIDESPFYSINMFLPVGISYNTDRLKYGVLYYVNYDFSSLLTTGQLNFQIESSQTQYGIFIPVLDVNNSKPYSDFSKNSKELTIFNTNADNYISLETDNITINNKDKAYMTMEDGVITIKNNKDNETIVMDNKIEITSKQDVIKLQDGISLNSSAPIDISTNTASLYEVLNDILTMLTNMNLDPVAGNGSPLSSPTLTKDLPGIITKLNGVLK